MIILVFLSVKGIMNVEVHSEPNQVSKIERFVKTVNGLKQLTIFSILYVRLASYYTFGICFSFAFKVKYLLKTMIPTRFWISLWRGHGFYEVWKLTLKFHGPHLLVSPLFITKILTRPYQFIPPDWLHISRAPLTFLLSLECD